MSSTRSVRRAVLDRIDVRLALFIGGMAAVLCSAPLCGVVVYAVFESLEESQVLLENAASDVAGMDVVPSRAAPPLRHDIVYRVVDRTGEVRRAGGHWPAPPVRMFDAISLTAALTSRDGDYLRYVETDAAGSVVEIAMPLAHFVEERGELVTAVEWVLPLALCCALGFGIVVARRALAPVRETGSAIRAIDVARLDVRLPSRGTSDDVDQLVAAINEVLARLEWAFERLSGVGADVAHELRTPLNRMLSTIEVALMDSRHSATTGDVLESVRETAQQMQESVEALLLLARGEEGRLRLVRERTDVGELLGGLVDFYRPLAEESGRQLEFSPGAASVDVDRQLVTRALANVLENALCHADPTARIRASLSQREGRAIVTIEDSGPGIPAEDRERIFGRFVRLDAARSGGGSGLGLALARMIARLHDGALWVDGSPLGGAAFHLALGAGSHDR